VKLEYLVFISDIKEDLFLNEVADYLLRTKPSSQKDGGVASGVACLDTPYLV